MLHDWSVKVTLSIRKASKRLCRILSYEVDVLTVPSYPSNLCQSYYVSAKLPSCPFFSSTIVTVRRVGWEMVSFHGCRTLTFHQGFVYHVANSKKRKFILVFLDSIKNDLWNKIMYLFLFKIFLKISFKNNYLTWYLIFVLSNHLCLLKFVNIHSNI